MSTNRSPTRAKSHKAVESRKKEEIKQARRRAREWAKKSLGQKRKSASAPPARAAESHYTRMIIVEDEDEEEEVKPMPNYVGKKEGNTVCNKGNDSCAKCKALQHCMLKLIIEITKVIEILDLEVSNGALDLQPDVADEEVFSSLDSVDVSLDVADEDIPSRKSWIKVVTVFVLFWIVLMIIWLGEETTEMTEMTLY